MAIEIEAFRTLNIDPGLWRNKPEGQIIDEIASIFAETKLQINYTEYCYSNDGVLIYEQTGLPIRGEMEDRSPLGKLEVAGFDLVEKWGWNNGEGGKGLIAWISAPHSLRSELAKIGLSEVVQTAIGLKMVNRFVRLKLSGKQCVELAKSLNQYSLHKQEIPNSAEILRAAPVLLRTLNETHWTFVFDEVAPNEYWGQIRRGEDLVMRETQLQQASGFHRRWDPEIRNTPESSRADLGYRMQRDAKARELMGDYGIDCPTHLLTAFQILSGDLPSIEGSFDCPSCHLPIPSGRGITTCPHCGARKESYQSCD